MLSNIIVKVLTMKYLLTIYIVITFTSINGQTDDMKKIDSIIDTIFTAPDGTGQSNLSVLSLTPDLPNRESGSLDLSPGAGIPGTGSCECIPYYLCNNGTPCTDGCGIIDIRINDGPCQDYLTQCCEPEHKVVEPVTLPPDINKLKGCGVRNPNGVGFRIKGDMDNEAQFGEFPWMVAILREEGIEADTQKLLVYQCGGSLIHPQVVLTSTHCVAAKNKNYQIRAGEWDTQTRNELLPHQDRTVVDIISHPGFNSGALFNDISLLILDTPLDIEENVDTICLPSQDEILGNIRCFASGWGKDVFEKEGKYQVILKKIDVPVIQRELCQEQLRKTRLGHYFILDPSFVCAGGEKGRDTCRGDGGSPLVCPHPENSQRYFQGGIVAWGIGCGLENVPGVYANVAKFRNWVDEQMNKRGYGTSSYTF